MPPSASVPASRSTWRDPASALTHFFGFVAGTIGLVVLLAQSSADVAKQLAFGLYGVSLCVLFLASTTYHFFDLGERRNKMLRRFDHAAIFCLIAGTNVPILMHLLEGKWRVVMLSVVVGVGALGVLFKLTWFSCPRWLDALLYVGMGWIVLIAGPVMWPTMSAEHAGWLLAGGGFFMVGAVIYALKRPDPWPGVFGFHEVWHVFVLGGAACHYGLAYSLLETPYRPF